jgi:hypothetical protein
LDPRGKPQGNHRRAREVSLTFTAFTWLAYDQVSVISCHSSRLLNAPFICAFLFIAVYF